MLECYRWEKARGQTQHYRRRQPESSVLYQLVYHSRDDLERTWEERFQPTYGVLRDEVLTTFDEYRSADFGELDSTDFGALSRVELGSKASVKGLCE